MSFFFSIAAIVSIAAVFAFSSAGPGFVFDMMALLLFGSLAMTILALSRSIADALTGSRCSYAIRRAAVNIAAAAGAAQAAAFLYIALGDAPLLETGLDRVITRRVARQQEPLVADVAERARDDQRAASA